MKRAEELVEHPQSWWEIPESGVVYAIGVEAGTMLMEWRPAPDGTCIEYFVHRAIYDRRRGWTGTLPLADFRLRLFHRIHQSWDPCVYPLGFPFQEGSAP
ncbi:hypothetical protein FZ103_04375 [Streptomonospora sp. PA3]|uniref:hypothetical protein n=1 Tax=Streptomonospora sp. PA3 TaxID=2607326 RepID=UPI0012DBEF6F|nr:hypothetical protein [Streptomonospora sp. PA3]MUL40421.1 hypothetical protein [Streptomonospora sp. PA3]